MNRSKSFPGKEAHLPALSAGSSGSDLLDIFSIPIPHPCTSDCYGVLLGAAIALTALRQATGPGGTAEVVSLLADPELPQRLARGVAETGFGEFGNPILRLNPYWVAAALAVIEPDTITAARPATIGGYPALDVVVGAVALASHAKPFVPPMQALVALRQGEGGRT